MKLLFLYFIIFIGCSGSTENEKSLYNNDIKCIRITRNFPVFEITDSVAKLIRYDTFRTIIYQYKNQEMYQTFYHYTGLSNLDSVPGVSEYRSNYFVYTKGKSHGLFYDSNKGITGKIVNVDSMLKKQQNSRLEVKDLFAEAYFREISRKENPQTKDIEEVYKFIGRGDSTMTGTVIFSYTNPNKFDGINYSFSNELDHTKKMKLYKIQTITEARFIGPPNNIYMDRVEAFYLLETIKNLRTEEILKLFRIDASSYK